ncbi:carbamoyltransferase family protein [Actinosynnema mirum]|uniref:Carbamoyltransferase n=1 Tax=Actinosynnema mirum (strain ATCC 29888 / DSM 43827 / JCM 3225 / NBRC 14064 / NCIMB 13271 / NRRL B-12336 / IMRU 3971 / 101) TaxID=446462 RepID=C6WEJ5_ACTMD|nr:carbamoyltransferase [Actinosynnema mirum]ACU37795.1 Carbamoyltransferase [Actinosynnema mirum DSM 43827]
MAGAALGISAYYHDSAAALVDAGGVVAAAQQERFSRRRHDASFPDLAVRYCLAEAGAKLDDLDAVAYYEDPRLKLRRVLATFAATAPRAWPAFRDVAPEWLAWKGRAASVVRNRLRGLGLGAVPPVRCYRHHESHAASAFLPSPYESAAVLCVDGVGEWATTSIWHGRGERVEPVAELRFPHSLGMLYSAFTHFCGFKVDSGEYKLMGLAPYGRPVHTRLIREELVDVKPDGSFRLHTTKFEFPRGRVMTGRAFEELFGGPRRLPEGPLTEREFDLAASVQQVTEEIVLGLARAARERTGESRLCLAGGVALNCVANGKLAQRGLFDELWVQPAAGDAGGALGAALLAARPPRAHVAAGKDAMRGARLGPSCTDEEVRAHLVERGLPHHELTAPELSARVADLLARGKVVAWFQGRMEFGPRALGSRSILGDARDPRMQSTMNLKIKFRESFRPFAPVVLAEDAADYFDLTQPSPYMLIVSGVAEARRLPEEADLTGLDRLRAKRSTIPAVTHVDHSARVQTVTADTDPRLHALLTEFKSRTGCPVLVNTSFNVRGEPIVATPEDAYRCFMRTDVDALAINDFLLLRADQPPWREEADWRDEIPLD